MDVICERLAELWTLKSKRPLSIPETDEFIMCMDALTNRVWRMVRLKNLSLIASMLDDLDWQYEICAEIDRLEK